MSLTKATWGLAGAAVLATALVHADPWRTGGGGPVFVSTRSAARRVFPSLEAVAVESVAVKLHRVGDPPVSLVPTDDGHVVRRGEEVLGPADPDAFDGLLAMLRMGTTLRAVGDPADLVGVGRSAIDVRWMEGADGSTTLLLGERAPEESGLYGTIREGGTESAWVVEAELGELVEQAPEAWVAQRALVVEPSQIQSVRWADGAFLERGADGLWRSQHGGRSCLLAKDAVEARLDRLVGARLDPLIPLDPQREGSAWVELLGLDGRRYGLRQHGACPSGDHRVLVSRGMGWAGCIAQSLTEPWPVPGDASPPDGAAAWLESRLLPHEYGRVLRIALRLPQTRELRRYGGNWRIASTDPEDTVEIDAAPVFEWYRALHEAEVVSELDFTAHPVDVELELATDSTVSLVLRCSETDDGLRCRHDEGPWFRILDEIPPLRFDAETFTDRKLLDFAAHDARAIEVTDGGQPTTVRQSLHFDMGVWRLDRPEHPDGDEAIDDLALEDLLATLSGLRAEGWVERPSEPATRVIRVERTPRSGRETTLEVELHTGCIVVIDTRAAKISESVCSRLGHDLLQGDALHHWIDTARTLELGRPAIARWTRSARGMTREFGDEAADQTLERLANVRHASLEVAKTEAPATGVLRVLRAGSPAFMVRWGEGWAQLEGADWRYRWSPTVDQNTEP